jgi:hypothetical protein
VKLGKNRFYPACRSFHLLGVRVVVAGAVVGAEGFDLDWAVVVGAAALVHVEGLAKIVVAVGDVIKAAPFCAFLNKHLETMPRKDKCAFSVLPGAIPLIIVKMLRLLSLGFCDGID